MIDLKETVQNLYKYTKQRQQEGKIRLHLGLQGHLVLMLDKLDRVLEHKENAANEIRNLASDALIALWYHEHIELREAADRRDALPEEEDE